jgi:non-specific serine/threonine protein kinase
MQHADDNVSAALVPALTPQGHLLLAPAFAENARALPRDLHDRIETAFARGVGHGLLDLGAREVGTALPPEFAYWRDFAAQFVTTLCTSGEPLATGAVTESGAVAAPTATALADLVNTAPPMAGGEYLTAEVLRALWQQTEAAYRAERALANQSLQDYLKERNPAWHLIGRVHFNLAENRTDEEAPFAFIATYTTRLSAQAKAQHQPLAEALREYAGAKNRARLLSLLQPVQEGAGRCAWLHAMVESG